MEFNKIYESSEEIPEYRSKETEFVYVCQLGEKVKIGITNNPKRRMIHLECGCGEFFNKMYISNPQEDARRIEGMLHAYFQNVRGIGEWFHTSFNDVIPFVEDIDKLEKAWDEGFYMGERGKKIINHEIRKKRLNRKNREEEIKREPPYVLKHGRRK